MTIVDCIYHHTITFLAFHEFEVFLHLAFLYAIAFFTFTIVEVKGLVACFHQIIDIISTTPVTETSVKCLVAYLCILVCCHNSYELLF